MIKYAVPLLAFASFAACATDTADRRVTVVRDSAGIRIVENSTGQWESKDQWYLGSAPLIDIGGETGDPNSELYRVVGALRLDDGRIVIANGGSHQLRFYDPSGGYVGAAGGRGDGPGEFQGIRWAARYSAAVMPPSTVSTWPLT